MSSTRAADSDDVVLNLMRLLRVCPRWADDTFSSVNCWCHSSRTDDGQTANCPKKPEGWKPGMPGSMEES